MVKKILAILKNDGLRGLARTILNRIFPQRADSFKLCKSLILNKSGLEIGGPSEIFSSKGLLPIYSLVRNLDNCNFSSETIWGGKIKAGYTFDFDKNRLKGFQYVLDSTDLANIPAAKYDFLLSSHVIEHIANPIKALKEWIRILKEEGILIVILPHKDGTFDHKRNITELKHLIDDYKNNTSESDLTHLEEILELHDLERDPVAGSFSQFKMRSENNYEDRCLHHHVFNSYLAVGLIDFVKLKILSVEAILPFHIIIIAKKSENYDNQNILNEIANCKLKSPFTSDKLFKIEDF